MKTFAKVCFIEDQKTLPMERYFGALKDEFGEQQVEWFSTIDQADEHFKCVAANLCEIASLYIIDLMMPALNEKWAKLTASGMTSGLYLLSRLREVDPRDVPTPALILTSVSNPLILDGLGGSLHVQVQPKLSCLPYELAEMARTMLEECSLTA